MHTRRQAISFLSLCLILALLASCASTGPKVSRQERKLKEEEFNARFLEASSQWLPRIYRVGHRLISSHVPQHGSQKPKFGFVGVGVDDLKDYARKTYRIDKSIKGVLVFGVYPGSGAEDLDLSAGDVILKLNGKKTKNLGAYFKRVREAEGPHLKAEIWRGGKVLYRDLPVEKVHYNAQFFLAPTPDLDANAAFSKINVGIGAIRYCRNDDELAVIMGHELAHTTLKHSLKKLGAGFSTGVAYGIAAGIINIFTLPGVGNALIAPVAQATDAALSRRYEREADYFGLRHAFHAGYDVGNGAKVFSRLATDAPSYNLLAYTFATHPKSSERFLRLEKIVEELQSEFPGSVASSKHPDWEIIVPVEAGETVEEALEQLLLEKKTGEKEISPSLTSPEKDMATPASLDTNQASGYQEPKTSSHRPAQPQSV